MSQHQFLNINIEAQIYINIYTQMIFYYYFNLIIPAEEHSNLCKKHLKNSYRSSTLISLDNPSLNHDEHQYSHLIDVFTNFLVFGYVFNKIKDIEKDEIIKFYTGNDHVRLTCTYYRPNTNVRILQVNYKNKQAIIQQIHESIYTGGQKR